MAGHRQDSGKLTRPARRSAHWAVLIAEAPTIEDELAVAFDWWRSAVRRMPDHDVLIIALSRQLVTEAQAMNGGPR